MQTESALDEAADRMVFGSPGSLCRWVKLYGSGRRRLLKKERNR